MKEVIRTLLSGLNQSNQTDQVADVMEKLRLVKDVLSNWIASEVENKVGGTADANAALTQTHLMTINTEQDEALFYECWLETSVSANQDAAGTDAPWANAAPAKNLRPTTKRHFVVSNKAMVEKEHDIFTRMNEQIA